MENLQQSHLDMFRTVSQHMANYNAVWSGVANFAALVTELNGNITLLEAEGSEQSADTTGTALAKAAAAADLIAQVMTIGNDASLWAVTNKKYEEQTIFDFTKSELEALSDEELYNHIKKFYSVVNANAAALVAYDVSAAKITALNTALAAYQGFIVKPRVVQIRKVVATDRIDAIIHATSTLLNDRMDRGMERFRTVNADFYDQYFEARNLLQPGSTPDPQTFTGTIAGGGTMIDVPSTIFSPGRSISLRKAAPVGGPFEASFSNVQGNTAIGQPTTSVPTENPFVTTCGAMGYTTVYKYLTLINNTPDPIDYVVVVG